MCQVRCFLFSLSLSFAFSLSLFLFFLFAFNICIWNALSFFANGLRRSASNILTITSDYVVQCWIITCGGGKRETKRKRCGLLCYFFENELSIAQGRSNGSSVWAIEQTIADPCRLWGWMMVRSAKEKKNIWPSACFLSLLKVMRCLNEREGRSELNNYVEYAQANAAWALWWSMWTNEGMK